MIEHAISEAQQLAKKRDSASSLEEREYYQWLLDAAVQDICWLRNQNEKGLI